MDQRRAVSHGERVTPTDPAPSWPPGYRIPKEAAECCMSRKDDLGRPPIGYCSPECVRRPDKVDPKRG